MRLPDAAPVLDLRLRVAWGGGGARPWDAEIALSAGTLSDPVRLSMESNAPGSMAIDEGDCRLRLWQRAASAYDGVDFSLTAPRTASIVIRLTPRDNPRGAVRREIPLMELVSGFQNIPLDDRENRLLLRRAPGDQMRVQFTRESLVFSPGERFAIEATPHLTGFPPQTPLAGEAKLVPASGGAAVWGQTQELTADADGGVPSTGLLNIPLPREEGVYDLVFRLAPKGAANPVRPAPEAIERTVQLVVIADRPPASDDSGEPVAWRSVLEIDPANSKWWERLTRWPQLPKWIPGFDDEELASGELETVRRGDRRYMLLAPGGWRAFPLPLGHTPGPHMVEVSFPADTRQAIGVSILEPNAAGEVSPLGLDSGVAVVANQTDAGSEPGVHRLIFWPRTDAPVLLLTNQSRDADAQVGRIRILRGPASLPPAAGDEGALTATGRFASSERNGVYVEHDPFPADRRMLAAWFDRPLIPENFGAPEAMDEGTGRTLDDWTTFHLGAVRMIQYLKHRGYNAAAVSVWCEGSALYPSSLLAPTPKYDTGALFVSGQDPRRKDVLEMLLRLGDREGVRIIPSLQFSTPLPAIEKLLREDPENRDGLEWVNGQGATWLQTRGAPQGLAPYYNPLDERVQAAMLDVVHEMVDRYGGHRSFGGVALQLGPSSYALLPGQFWGFDDRTIATFEKDSGVEVPGEGAPRFRDREAFLKDNPAWLAWRAERMARLYREMGKIVAQAGPQAALYLAGVELPQTEPVKWMMRPALPRGSRFAEAMLHLGLDPKLWESQTNIVLPRPRTIAPLERFVEQAVSIELSAAADVNEFFGSAGALAALFYHETRPMRLAAFDEVSPFGPDRTYTWLAPHVALYGAEDRRRFAHLLARHDARTIFEGGWMLPLGQELGLQPLLDVYRRLPNVAFEDVPPTMGAAMQPVVVRQATHDGRTWIYVVNDSPWPISVELELDAPAACSVRSLGDHEAAPLVRRGMRSWWSVELAPYDVRGAVLSSSEARVVDYLATLPPQTLDELRRTIRDVGARAFQLRSPHRLDVLENAGFEQAPAGGRIPGWEYGGAWNSVAADSTSPHGGSQSLQLKSPAGNAPTWLRTPPIAPPATGRLAFSVWVRAADEARQPELRLAADWTHAGVSDYRFFAFGRGSPIPLSTSWREYVFPIPLPPGDVRNLRVGVDVYGPGEVWIDDVRLYDTWFEPLEKEELKKLNGGAEHDLNQGRVAECLQFLEGYWPQFLQSFVEPPPPGPIVEQPETPAAPPQKPTILDRVRRFSPSRLWPF